MPAAARNSRRSYCSFDMRFSSDCAGAVATGGDARPDQPHIRSVGLAVEPVCRTRVVLACLAGPAELLERMREIQIQRRIEASHAFVAHAVGVLERSAIPVELVVGG